MTAATVVPDLSALLPALAKALPWAAILAFLGVCVRAWAPWQKVREDSDKSLRADLFKQIQDNEKLHAAEIKEMRAQLVRQEERLDDQRKRYEERLETERKSYEARLEFQRATHAGETASLRHRVNNLEQCLNTLMLLIETNPERASEAAKKTRELREKQELAEAAEKSAITSAKIVASAPNGGC